MKQMKMNEKQMNSSREIDNFAKSSITDMKLSTDLQGRLRNISLPLQDSLLPLFEAVVNSIHAIDERKDIDKNFTIEDARIAIKIVRDGDTMDSSIKGDLVGFYVSVHFSNPLIFNGRLCNFLYQSLILSVYRPQ